MVTLTHLMGLELSGWLYKPKNQMAGTIRDQLSWRPEGRSARLFAVISGVAGQGIGVSRRTCADRRSFGQKFVNLDNGELRVNGVKDIKAWLDIW